MIDFYFFIDRFMHNVTIVLLLIVQFWNIILQQLEIYIDNSAHFVTLFAGIL